MKKLFETCNSQDIERLLNNQLTAEAQDRLETHLDHCDKCCDELRQMTAGVEQWSQVKDHLGTLLEGLSSGEKNTTSIPNLDFLNPTDDPHMLGRFAGYEIAGVIGTGGMGIVLKGFDRALNRYVAIKVLLPHFAASAAARHRFAREARAAAAVVHENVIEIYGVSVENDQPSLPYLVMRYIRGESLQKRLDRCGVLTTAETLRISSQIAAGLAAAHEQGLVHRDIKPANILLPEDIERVKITDFGLARAADDASLTRTGVIAGTPQYMSPEQADGRRVDAQSDLFSLGSVMYSMCTGRIPFRAETPIGMLRKIADDSPRPIQQINSEVPDWLCRIVDKLHAKEPGQRFESAAELARLLKQCLAHVQQPDSVSLPSQLATLSKSPIRTDASYHRRVTTGAFVMISILIVGMIGWVMGGSSPGQRHAQGTGILTQEHQPFKKQFTASFANPSEIGVLNVDIKRGAITVSGHDQHDLIVEMEVPNYMPETVETEGLRELRPNNLDFDITTTGNHIKVDSNSQQYITHLKIKVPHEINLVLDSYRDGDLRVSDVRGHLDIRSFHGNITLSGCSGSVDLWSYHGNLVASLNSVDADRSLQIESYNGSIDVSLPEDIRANTRLRTGHGKLLTDFDITEIGDPVQAEVRKNGTTKIEFDKFVRGRINGGGVTLELETEHGDIRIRQLSSDRHGRQASAGELDDLGVRLGKEWNEKLGQKLGEEWNQILGPKLGEEWNDKLGKELGEKWNRILGPKLGKEWSNRLNGGEAKEHTPEGRN